MNIQLNKMNKIQYHSLNIQFYSLNTQYVFPHRDTFIWDSEDKDLISSGNKKFIKFQYDFCACGTIVVEQVFESCQILVGASKFNVVIDQHNIQNSFIPLPFNDVGFTSNTSMTRLINE